MFKKKHLPILFLALALFLFLKILFFGSFIDEHENMVAGWLIGKGWVPYRDFFLHHAPLPYLMSSLLFPWAQKSWWLFRIVTLLFWSGGVIVVWKNIDKKLQLPVSLSLVLIALATPFLNLQMFLADTIVAVSIWVISMLFTSLFLHNFPRKKQVLKWLLFFGFISVWSSITSVFSFLILGLVLLAKIFKNYNFNWQKIWKEYKKMFSLFIGLNLIFPIYFLLSKGWKEFIWSVFGYNQQYYFPLRLAQNQQELRWGILYKTASRFFNLIFSETAFIFLQIKNLFLTFKSIFLNIFSTQFSESLKQLEVMLLTPLNLLTIRPETTLVLILVFIGFILILKKKFFWFFGFILFTMSLYMRSNEIFHYSSFFISALSLSLIAGFSKKNKGNLSKVFLPLIVLLWFWKFLPPYLEFKNNAFPIISSQRQLLADQIKNVYRQGDKLQVIGGGVTYYLLTDILPANKQIYYYKWFEPAEKLREPLHLIIKNQAADIVLLEEKESVLGGSYFDPKLVSLVEKQYTEVNQKFGIYVKKID